MKVFFSRALLGMILALFPYAAIAQLPFSPCSPAGGKRADIISAETKYRAPSGAAPSFTIPSGTKTIAVYVSSETGIPGPSHEYLAGDEDFLTINAIIDIANSTSSGYVNVAKSTHTNGSGTNVYGWKNAPLGAYVPVAMKTGDATPDLNNVNFTITGNTLTITEAANGTHSSFYVEYLSPYNNSLNPLDPQVRALLHGTGATATDLSIPIPAGTKVISISGKGTNSSAADLFTNSGTEEGYSNLRFVFDLDLGVTDGFVTVANGGSVDRRSTYVINDKPVALAGRLTTLPYITGDYASKRVAAGAVGIYDPEIYVSGSNLIIKRDADYARDFDDAYVVEFYGRVGLGMSAEFIDAEVAAIPKGFSGSAGVSRTFKIPSGTNFIYFNQTGNAVNTDREENENGLAGFAYIDLTAGTATGYFYQQVGLSDATRRDDNYAFKGVPLNNTSTRNHTNTVGFKGPNTYDISFQLSADKSQLTVTNKTGLAGTDYQFLLSADYYGARPDIAFSASNVTFTKTSCNVVRANVSICNPGAGNSSGGMPVSFYAGNPTVDATARLLYVDAFNDALSIGDCKAFNFDIDMSALSNLNVDLTMIINDNGSFVTGGVGHTVGTPFTLASLVNQGSLYRECYYDNNLLTRTISLNNCPVVNLDPDQSSGASGTLNYRDTYTMGLTPTGTRIADTDLTVVDPDGSNMHSATITLTNILNAGYEYLEIRGVLPAGISAAGNNTGTITLSGIASQTAYADALKLIRYHNVSTSPDKTSRIITAAMNDGTENGPSATATIAIVIPPKTAVSGNTHNIADGRTSVAAQDGTQFGIITGSSSATNTFSITNIGEGTLTLTGAVTISGDPGFSIASQPAATSLATGASTTFQVRFTSPAVFGTYNATVTIVSDDPDAGLSTYTFAVSAVANNIPAVSNHTVSTDEDVTFNFAATDFTGHYTDVDNTPLDRIRITSLPSNGTLYLSSVAITSGQVVAAADLANITFVPTANWNGSTSFGWTASDGTSYAASDATMNITVSAVNDAPTAAGPTSIAVNENTAVSMSGVSFADQDAGTGNMTATFTATEGAFSAVSGDGVTVGGTALSRTLTGSLADLNAFLAANKLTYLAADIPAATVTVTVNINDNGNTGSGGALQANRNISLNITAENDAPVATGDTQSTNEDTPVSGAVTATDPDGDVLAYAKATDPAHGSVTVASDGTYTYTPASNYHGTDQFTITVSDGHGGTATATVNVTILSVNDVPTGSNQTNTTNEDTPVSGTLTATDVENDPLTFTKATDPTNGTVTVDANGDYTYTPNLNYHGTDQFTVTVSDGNGGSTTLTVTITVNSVNDLPVASDQTNTTSEDTPVNGAITATDVDNDPLTFTKATDPTNGSVVVNSDGTYIYTPNPDYHGTDQFDVTITDGNGGSTTITVTITVSSVNDAPLASDQTNTTNEDAPVNGTITATDADNDPLTFTKATDPANGSVVVNSDGTYTYTPNPNYHGTDQFNVTITDGNGGSVTITITITVNSVNDVPVASNQINTTNEDAPVNGTITATDADSDPLTFTKATDPAHGSVVVNSDGTYTYTPDPNYHGTDQFNVTITDGNGGTITITITITVNSVNDVPVASNQTNTTNEDAPVNGTLTATDADNDLLTFTKATDPAHGTVVVNSDGTYTYTPNPDYHGTDQFNVTVSDGNGGTTTITVTVTVSSVNDVPVASNQTNTTNEDAPVNGTLTATDADNDPLTFTKATDPAHGTVVVNNDGTYTYTPDPNYHGTDQFNVTITDGNGGSTTITVTVTVNSVNDAPVVTNSNINIGQNAPATGTVTATDADGDPLTFTKSSDPTNGTVTVNTDGTYTYTPNADYHGTDQFTVTVSDGNGGTATATVVITVTAGAPGISMVKTASLEGSQVTYIFTVKNTGAIALTNVSYTDAKLGITDRVIPVGTGLAPGASVTATAIYAVTLADRIAGSVTNTATVLGTGPGGISSSDISGTTETNDEPTITILPPPPVAVSDSTGTRTGMPVIVNLLHNDDDRGVSFDIQSVEIVDAPQHGNVKVNADGTIVYTPNAGFNGEEVFSYRVRDAYGVYTNAATVKVSVSTTNVTVPNLFTPNGDGANDMLVIKGIEQYADNELVIVNRWGNEVFRQRRYNNAWRGDGLNEGTYYYVLRIRKTAGSEWEVVKGYITLIRAFKH
ncbi:Ig-like domain-containing protein [Chitinophaga sedimenti]|uniref:Ig-like domain-containing protein n=1 Tax=Chitinophaga sedimenti TaxID=2033606 RepID=UPI00200399E5|nr:Ig-like domain-containing protein [Chitinophaga sedimenti]MCK7555646.1 Ig-like domain-containing protein [Chitinophaga sedimenti]